MAKKKVLHLVEAMGGGVFTYLVELANGMCGEFDITVAFGIRSETPKNYEEYFDKRVKLIKVEHFTRGLNPVTDGKAFLEVRKIFKELNPDIIHMHSSKAGAIGRMMHRKTCQKMFYTPHGYSFLMEDVSPVKRNLFKLIEKVCGKRNCTTVACGKSEWEESKAVTKRSTYISNGINIEKMENILQRAAESVDSGDSGFKKFTVYTVGRADYQKNPEMFNRIAEKLPDINFVWIGDGELRSTLTSSNIQVMGWLEHEQVIKLAGGYDVFLLTSRYEGLPIALLEAMYMKKICVVTDVVGNHDVIINGYSGYTCKNEEEMVKVLEKLFTEGIEKQLTDNAYESIVNQYNSKCLVDGYTRLYNE